jgi:hypothetical protein
MKREGEWGSAIACHPSRELKAGVYRRHLDASADDGRSS